MHAFVSFICTSAIMGLVRAENQEPLYEHSLRPPFLHDLLNNKHWTFGGDAIMNVNRHIRLTSEMPSLAGWVWSKEHVPATSWQVEFEYKVTHSGTLSGDGFAFWYTSEKEMTGPVFGSKDYFNGLGIFFDTYANSRSRPIPYVMAMVGDGKKQYDHDFDGSNNEVGGCATEFRNSEHPTRVRIRYLKKELMVELDDEGNNNYRTCFKVDHVVLPEHGYFGFSALTGEITSSHDIISVDSWKIEDVTSPIENGSSPSLSSPSPSPNSQSYNSNHNNYGSHASQPIQQRSSGGWGFFTWLLILIVFSIGGYVAWVFYNISKQQSYKRF